MTFRHKPLPLVVAALFGALAAVSANAALITVGPVVFSNSASVTDYHGGGSTANNGATLGASNLGQFDPSLGVLTGATLNLTSSRTATTHVTSTDGPDNGNNNPVTSAGTGSSTARIAAPGISQSFSNITQADSCTGGRLDACTGSASSTAVPTDASLAASSNLNSYVGTGFFAVTRTAPTLTAEQEDQKFTGIESTVHTIAWDGSLNVDYTFSQHAVPSFVDVADPNNNVLTLVLDFGTFIFGDPTPPSLGFDIFNLAGDRVGLDLWDFDPISGPFTSTLATFFALGAGSSERFTVSMSTGTVGVFDHSYTLRLRDDATVGASDSHHSYTMTLNLKGTVNARQVQPDPPNGVPEPSLLALLGAGLTGLAIAGRRRRR